MSRRPRPIVASLPLHITQRGNNRAVMFGADDDYAFFLQALHVASERTRCAIHAYVLMTNHVHLLVTPGEASGPARMMQSVGCRYVRYFNDRYARTGTLWEGRYRSVLVDSHHYFFVCSHYIELNPVRADMVGGPALYPWSSFHRNAFGARDPVITPHEVYDQLGSSPLARQAAYRAMFRSQLDPAALAAIRAATLAGTVLGTDRFRAELELLLQRRMTRSRRRDRRQTVVDP